MQDLIFAVCLLLISFGVGVPIARLLPSSARASLLAAPGLGFSTAAIATTLAYRYGLPLGPTALVLAVFAASAASWLCLRFIQDRRSLPMVGVIVGVAAAVLLLCLLPKWTGGAQFAAFQGNPYDHMNYLARAVSFKSYPYVFLQDLDRPTTINNFLDWVSGTRDRRPAVAMVLAALTDLMRMSVVERSYAYIAGLQAMMFFPATFLILNLFRTREITAALGGAALTLGFPMQYVLDINAWSELATMPIAVLTIALVCMFLASDEADRAPRPKDVIGWIIILGLLLASFFFLYPEILPAYGSAIAGAIAVWLFTAGRTGFRKLAVGLGGVLFGILLCAFHLRGTLGFLMRQVERVTLKLAPDWWRYFQAYLFDYDLPGFFLPVNTGLALVGLYPLLPQPDTPPFLIWIWQLLDALVLIGVLVAAFLAWRRAWDKVDLRPRLLLGGTASASIFLIVLLLLGRYWAAGKGLSMIAPLIFFVLSAPLLFPAVVSLPLRLATVVFWGGYLAFGLARPIAAAHESGIHYAHPYPSTMNAHSKTRHSWDLERHRKTILGCGTIQVDLGNDVFLERYVQLYLTDLGTKWFTTQPLNGYFGRLRTNVVQPRLENPDCFITVSSVEARSGVVIDLGRDTRLKEFLHSGNDSLELAPDTPPEIKVSGLYPVERYKKNLLRWTRGTAQFEVPIDLSHPPKRISLKTWPLGPPRRRITIRVNGSMFYDGPMPADSEHLKFRLGRIDAPSLKIELSSEAFRGEGDARDLGIPIRELRIYK